jgi:hypothetical protein
VWIAERIAWLPAFAAALAVLWLVFSRFERPRPKRRGRDARVASAAPPAPAPQPAPGPADGLAEAPPQAANGSVR